MALIDYYTRRRDGSTSFILFDREAEPDPDLSYAIVIATALSEAAMDGLTSEKDKVVVDQISDALASLTGPHQYVGTVTSSTEVTWYYYSSDPKSFEQAVARLSLARRVKIYHRQDSNWDRFFECVAPDATEFQRMQNRELISTFEADGDDIFEPRNVIFWLYFETESGRDVALATFHDFEFDVYDSSCDEGADRPYSLGLQRVQPLDYFSVDQATDQIMGVVQENGGSFDGWEAQTKADRRITKRGTRLSDDESKPIEFQDEALSELSSMFIDGGDSPTPVAEHIIASNFDYTAESLSHLEKFLSKIHQAKLTDDEYHTVVLRSGAYLGEVVKRNSALLDWHWLDYATALEVDSSVEEFGEQIGTAAVLLSDDGHMLFPLAKVEKFIAQGESENLCLFADVAMQAGEIP